MADETTENKKKSTKAKQVQPKKHAPKDRAASRLRRKKIIQAILKDKSATQAGIDSGLSPKTAASQVSQILKEPKTQSALLEAFKKIGMDDAFLAEQHRDLILGKKVVQAIVMNPDGEEGEIVHDFVEVPDYVAKAKGLEMAYKLTGQFASEKIDHNIKRNVTVIVRKFAPDNDAGK